MGRKVLISFLGTSRLDASRKYRPANYRFPDSDENMPSSFIASVLKEHHKIDTLILIGTVKSIWEEAYTVIVGSEADDRIGMEVFEHCLNADHKSELSIPHKEEIERAFGNGSKIILLNYGLNREEIHNNQNKILGIEQYLKSGDELYVDITHSFRSLPLFLMNTLIYLQNVSPKKIKINSISYGMLDVAGELGYVPVVELNDLMNTMDWITGAYNFMEFGNAYKISELLRQNDMTSEANILYNFTEVKDLNHLNTIQGQAQKLSGILNKNYPLIAEMAIKPAANDFVKKMGDSNLSPAKFQYQLAKYHFDKKAYGLAYMVLTEATVTYICEKEKIDWTSQDSREIAKGAIWDIDAYKDVKSHYRLINPTRNQIAHSLNGGKKTKEMIKELTEAIKVLGEIIMQ